MAHDSIAAPSLRLLALESRDGLEFSMLMESRSLLKRVNTPEDVRAGGGLVQHLRWQCA